MQALQRVLQTIAAQLKGLSSTAKLLVGSFMIIVVMSLFLVWLYAGRQSMAPLGLGANISEDMRARTISFLEGRSIPYEQDGADVLVPVDQKFTILAQLTENQVIGGDQINFDKLMRDDSPFRTRDQNRQRYLVAKMNMLSGMIGQMSGIERASVVIDQPDGPMALGKSHVPPSASVTVLPRDGELTQAQVDAIAQLVAGSHAGLKRHNVAIVDARTGRAMPARTDDLMSAGKYMEVKLQAERHVKDTLENALGFIPNVRIAVNAQVDTTEVLEQTSIFEEPKIGVTQESTTSTSNTASPASGGEPAVRSNTGATLAGSARASTQSTSEKSQTASVPAFPKRDSQIRDHKGYALQINASIGVPKSYFVRLFQDGKGDGPASPTQPDQAALEALVKVETQKIKEFVTPLIDTQAMEGAVAGTVAVNMIPDFGPVYAHSSDMLQAGHAPGSGSIATVSRRGDDGLVKYVGLGGLALLSLAMMFLMVRKASMRQELPTASELVGIPPALAAAESDLVGEADEASPALEGLELNDDAIRRQQMLDQITDMVSNTPEDAAGLLRRWIKSEA